MDVEMRLIWFALAGFLLGFSVSTLWEWLYFRRRRAGVRELTEPEEKNVRTRRTVERVTAVESATLGADMSPEMNTEMNTEDEEWQTSYRSPGVYLEFEEDADSDSPPAADKDSDQDPRYIIEDEYDLGEAFAGESYGGQFGGDADLPDEEAAPASTSRTAPDSGFISPGERSGQETRSFRNPAVSNSSAATSQARSAPVRSTSTRSPVARTSRPAAPEIYRVPQRPGSKPEARPGKQDVPPRVTSASAPVETSSATNLTRASGRSQSEPAQRGSAQHGPAQSGGEEGARPAAGSDSRRSARRNNDYPDDLAKIKGIGEVYKQRLYAAGIYTWHQIAQTDEDILRAATQAYPSSNADEWAEQAEKLAEKHGRVGAVYTGPPPQELTRIYGIGPVGATTLYRAGICTYAQLAAATPETLAPLFPIAVAGDEPDFAHWIAQARELSKDVE